jgi:hypothetical protein
MAPDSLLSLTLPLILLELALLCFAVYVFLQVPKKYYLKLIMIPLAFVVSIGSIVIFDMMLGYAYPSRLPDKFVLIGHHVIFKDGKKHSIEVWTKKKTTRLYVEPYSKQLEKALNDAAKKQNGQGEVEMNRRSKKEAGKEKGGEAEDYPFESNLRLPHDIIQKDPIEGQPREPQLQEEAPINTSPSNKWM